MSSRAETRVVRKLRHRRLNQNVAPPTIQEEAGDVGGEEA